MSEIKGKTVVITGASFGIGAQATRVFTQAGARVVLLARSEGAIQKLAAEFPDSTLAVKCDVSDFLQVEYAMGRAQEHFGSLDVLINNAGVIQPINRLADSDPSEWAKAIDINLKGVYFCARAVLPIMLSQGAGSILTVSSGAASNPVEAWSHYCASKAGAAMLTRVIDVEERHQGIRAIGLSPGTVATQMQRDIKASGINPVSQMDWNDHIPPDWPARALLWMCGADADGFLGQEISLKDPGIRRRVGLI